MDKVIIGAGLAGLIAACHFKDAHIVEAGGDVSQHKALLRFRSKAVSELTGIPFNEVRVNKGIYESENHRFMDRCTIQTANLYSQKVSGGLRGRSIWNLDPVTRYVAPDDFHAQLAERHASRISYWSPIYSLLKHHGDVKTQYISTAPLHVMADITGIQLQGAVQARSSRAEIRVDRYRLPAGSDVYQTIYYPEPSLRVFRASITGDILIVESIAGGNYRFELPERELEYVVCRSFGISKDDLTFEDTVDQKYGKIVDMPSDLRKAALYELTRDYGVYSLGRFATWRNILLDDVVKDIHLIDSLMQAGDYGHLLAQSRKIDFSDKDFDIPF